MPLTTEELHAIAELVLPWISLDLIDGRIYLFDRSDKTLYPHIKGPGKGARGGANLVVYGLDLRSCFGSTLT